MRQLILLFGCAMALAACGDNVEQPTRGPQQVTLADRVLLANQTIRNQCVATKTKVEWVDCADLYYRPAFATEQSMLPYYTEWYYRVRSAYEANDAKKATPTQVQAMKASADATLLGHLNGFSNQQAALRQQQQQQQQQQSRQRSSDTAATLLMMGVAGLNGWNSARQPSTTTYTSCTGGRGMYNCTSF